ncbi:MAG TPA: hypothetical protein VE860_00380 [Chthoniobacterales bacterium]|nr:hypothetical protein [Chthoniobacterales bacterium]
MPLLRQRDGEHSAIRQDWLCLCLYRAAEKAGYSRWWLAEHVAASVAMFLSTTFDRNVISEKQLREIVLAVLQAIGYAEIALRLDRIVPPFELSLSAIAEEAGPGYELAFFRLLEERIQPALSDRACAVSINGLQLCVRKLQSVKTWTRECTRLRIEIVNFLRGRFQQADLKSEIILTIR